MPPGTEPEATGAGRGGNEAESSVQRVLMAIHPRATFDLPVCRAALEQRVDRDAQMRLQDVHSFLSRNGSGRSVRPAVWRLDQAPLHVFRVGEFGDPRDPNPTY